MRRYGKIFFENKLNKIEFIKNSQNKRYFFASMRSQRLVNFIFQRIFRINAECRFSVHFTSRIIAPNKISFGKGVEKSFLLSGHCYFQALNGIIIGDGTIFGPGVKIISSNHDMRDFSHSIKCRPINIGKNCWIGTNVIILPGVELGNNTIIGAGAIVNKSFKKGNVIIISDRELKFEQL